MFRLHSKFAFCAAHPIPFRIPTCKKGASNSFRIRTSKMQDLKPFRIRTYERTPGGWGLIVNQRSDKGTLCHSFQVEHPFLAVSSRFLGLRVTDPRSRNTGYVFSACLCERCLPRPGRGVSALSLLLSSHQSRITSHCFRNFYPPASDLRHNPAAQGQHLQPIPQTGRIQ